MRGLSDKQILDGFRNYMGQSEGGDISPKDAAAIAAAQGGNVSTPAAGPGNVR